MPNKYKDGTKAILVRLPEEDKKRVEAAAGALNMQTTEFARQAILERVAVVEKLMASKKPAE